MEYILKYFVRSEYPGVMRRYYMEFEKITNLIKFIKDNNIYDFTIYKKYDIVKNEK